MSQFNELSEQQQASISALVKAMAKDTQALLALLDQIRLRVAYYVGNVEGDVAALDEGALIPNPTDLAGAEPITKEHLVNQIGYWIVMSDPASGASGSYNTPYHRALYAKLIGPENVE